VLAAIDAIFADKIKRIGKLDSFAKIRGITMT
jgi:hypothetical protein